MRKITLLLLLFMACIAIAFAGSFHYREGEIIRGGAEFNALIDEKLDAADYVVGTPTNVAASDTIVIPSAHIFLNITENSLTNNNLLSFTVATDGAIMFIQNSDTDPTSGIATITTGDIAIVMQASGTWKKVLDQNDLRRLVLRKNTDVTASNTITIPLYYSYVRIADNATDSNNLLSFTAGGPEGRLIYIYNGDASATSGIATISSGKMGSVMYASGSYRLLSDE